MTYPSAFQSIVNVLTSVLQLRNLTSDSSKILLEGGEKRFKGVEQCYAGLNSGSCK